MLLLSIITDLLAVVVLINDTILLLILMILVAVAVVMIIVATMSSTDIVVDITCIGVAICYFVVQIINSSTITGIMFVRIMTVLLSSFAL